MTLNRTLLTITILILGTLAFLSFAPPQTGKWVYMWQAYVWPAPIGEDKYLLESGWATCVLPAPANFTGDFNVFMPTGQLLSVKRYKQGVVTNEFAFVYESDGSLLEIQSMLGETVFAIDHVDRRAELGIEVE